MELKTYQKQVMDDLSSYLGHLNRDRELFAAWKGYWMDKDIPVGLGGVPAYRSAIPGVPHVCTKVPTGGGKTFMACAALKRIFDTMPLDKPQVVVWLVPSDSILTQTIRNLSNPDHEYRLRLNSDFAGRVGVYTKEMLLSGQQFSPDTVREMLTVCVLSYASLRIDSKKKDVRKVYQENGNLLKFAQYFKDDSVLLADTPDTALIQVLRQLSPVTVVDESHNAGSDLSVEMLNNLNPSFVLDLTATPRKNSNILSYVDELGKTDLMSRDCPIRYIITVNALKEGWDCPFAYILASLANKTSKVDVEQILGRILRQPYAKRHKSPLLNMSYVFTCSNDFRNTLDSIVSGLNMAGFSRKDFRVGEAPDPAPAPKPDEVEQMELGGNAPAAETDSFDDVDTEAVKGALEGGTEQPDSPLGEMLQDAQRQADSYDAEMKESGSAGFWGGELGEMLNQNAMQPQFVEEASALRIPQFFLKGTPDLFGGEYDLLEAENLSEGFSLSGQDAQISFELATSEMYRVDLQEKGEAIPKYMRVSKEESEYIRERLAKLPPEKKVQKCVDLICGNLNRNDRYAAQEISAYVHRVVENMTEDELAAMETAIPTYARKIQHKIDGLERAYRTAQFKKWLDSGKVVCRESYALPQVITPLRRLIRSRIPYTMPRRTI
ncbi:DEAD/DEAH box helicase [Acutalibacter sp. 1XD8-33]|uniref:DEAD/DEAH box helicase n=1 Tax=Acutalibacter sp. 1XD8-33 TaxID=2320081 RepID=UPI0018F6A7AB|nr:DEAD/DEAH box helicase family protein [Acutalibacter sp. 1XD8-33]